MGLILLIVILFLLFGGGGFQFGPFPGVDVLDQRGEIFGRAEFKREFAERRRQGGHHSGREQSAGQGVGAVTEILSVRALCEQLMAEYQSGVARLVGTQVGARGELVAQQ